MALTYEPTAKQRRDWAKWVKSRPAVVRAIAERFEPWRLYMQKSTGLRVIINSFYENGTVSILVLAKFNHLMFERKAFGIDPNDLEECDLPDFEEGSVLLTHKEVEDNIDSVRALIRPDLFGPDGKRKN